MLEVLAQQVPQIIGISVGISMVLGALWKIVGRVNEGQQQYTAQLTTTVDTLSQRHEQVQQTTYNSLLSMVKDNHAFHKELSEKSNKVIVDNTVALARIMEKLK